MLIRFWWPWPSFQGHTRTCWKRLENCLSAPYLLKEQMDFDHTCTSRLLGHIKELIRYWWPWLHFQDHMMAKMVWKWLVCTLSPEWMDGFFTKLVYLYCWDMEKNWLDFGDHDPIFKVTGGFRLLEIGLSLPYLMKEWMDFDQTCTTILLWHEKELIRFWWPWPHFQGHRRAQFVGKWLFCTLSPEWMDGFWSNLYSYIVEIGIRTD